METALVRQEEPAVRIDPLRPALPDAVRCGDLYPASRQAIGRLPAGEKGRESFFSVAAQVGLPLPQDAAGEGVAIGPHV